MDPNTTGQAPTPNPQSAPTGQPPTVPPVTPTAPPPTGEGNASAALYKKPEEYATKKWAQDINSEADVWKKLAGAQELLGRPRVVRPEKDAPTEVWQKFKQDMGCPEVPEGYEFQTIEPLKDRPRDPNVDNKIKQILHDEMLPKEVGERIIQKLENVVFDMQKPMLEQKTKLESEFLEMRKKVFGQDETAAVAAFKTTLAQTLSDKPELTAKLNEMPNDQLVTLTAFAKSIHDKFAKESGMIQPGSSTTGQSNDIKAQYQSISQEKLAVKADPNIASYIKDQKLQILNKKMMELGTKAREQNIDLFS